MRNHTCIIVLSYVSARPSILKESYTNLLVEALGIALIGCTMPTKSRDFPFICDERAFVWLVFVRTFGDPSLIHGSRASGRHKT